MSLINNIQVNDVVRYARGTMTSFDFKASRSLMRLDGGEMSLAVGGKCVVNARCSHHRRCWMSDNINNDFAPKVDVVPMIGAMWPVFSVSSWCRSAKNGKPKSLCAMITTKVSVAPIVRKLGLRYQPSKDLLFRASVGSGFRAPSMSDLYRPWL